MRRFSQALASSASALTALHAGLVRDYLRKTRRSLSAFHIAQIYMWEVRFGLWYCVLDRRLCILFSQEQGCFMFLPPLGKAPTQRTLADCFDLMNRINATSSVSRIENVPEGLASRCRAWGYDVRPRAPEYVYERRRLADLAGNAFKSKRAGCNQFQRRFAPVVRAYAPRDLPACREVLRRWAAQRRARNNDDLYGYLLADSVAAQESVLARAGEWDLAGRVVQSGKRVVGYTFGYALNDTTWCVLFETCDPAYAGSAAYLFREICAEFSAFRWVNCLDDGELARLRRAKLSYRPHALLPVYGVAEPPGEGGK